MVVMAKAAAPDVMDSSDTTASSGKRAPMVTPAVSAVKAPAGKLGLERADVLPVIFLAPTWPARASKASRAFSAAPAREWILQSAGVSQLGYA